MEKTTITNMNYVDLLSHIEETNRCPGGKRTITKIMNSIFLPDNPSILEIGSNTGFTSIELAKLLPNATIVGIDINKNAVNKSKQALYKETKQIQDRVNFQLGDATSLKFRDNSFDFIITGGANTFIEEDNREQAVKEYKRVLKPNGFLSITNLFYDKPVPLSLLNELESILGFRIKPWRRGYWLDLFLNSNMELFSYEEVKMKKRSSKTLNDYIDELIDLSDLKTKYTLEIVDNFKNRWFEIMEVFNNNHEYLSFMIVILRNNTVKEQRELFIEEGSLDPWSIKREEKIWNEC